ncbi:MAG: alpha/beta fold hydrolase [Spirochaetales bacterium]|nr:alpha/beta fold hydrolase [Spirochaetales bacterium]
MSFTKRKIDYTKNYNDMALLDESDFTNQMFETAHPFMNQFKKDCYAEIGVADNYIERNHPDGVDKLNQDDEKIKIHYETYFLPKETSRGTIFMLHGFTGFTGKFYEVIYYFLKQNYSVVALDFRGHGYSYRELDDGHFAKTYIHNFDSFISDTLKVYDEAIAPNKNDKPVIIYSHSMGGGVAANLIEQRPELFDGAILSCPMLGMITAGLPNWLIKIICRLQIAKNGGTDYIIGAHDFDYKGEFKMNCGPSVSFNRYAYYNELRKVDKHYFSKYATYRFIFEAINGGKKAAKPRNAAKVTMPVLMFQAETDKYVKAKEQEIFAENASNCEVVMMSGTEHELFSSHNEILHAYYYEIFSFCDKIFKN